MKKKLILLIVVLLVNTGLTACTFNKSSDKSLENKYDSEIINDKEELNKANTETEYELTEEGIIKPEFAKKIIQETSDKVIQAISIKNFEVISKYAHPVKGVRFTPYTNVSIERDIVFNGEKLINFFEEQKIYVWGYYDGIGDEIKLTPSEYYERFIYSKDFVNAEEVGYNEVLSSGNMFENQFEVYENPIIVEYYFSIFDEDYIEMDWRSLRLVFEEHENNWNLVGIIHNQWTI